VKEKMKPPEILRRLNAQHGKQTLSGVSVYDWYNEFSEGRNEVKTQLSAGSIIASMFWDSEGVIHIDFIPHDVTINEQCHSNLLQAIRKKILAELSRMIILLHDNARPHTANLTKEALVTVGREIRNHPSYGPNLTSSDFHLFGPRKVQLGGQKFQIDAELKCGILN
jgi:hypothetical protein